MTATRDADADTGPHWPVDTVVHTHIAHVPQSNIRSPHRGTHLSSHQINETFDASTVCEAVCRLGVGIPMCSIRIEEHATTRTRTDVQCKRPCGNVEPSLKVEVLRSQRDVMHLVIRLGRRRRLRTLEEGLLRERREVDLPRAVARGDGRLATFCRNLRVLGRGRERTSKRDAGKSHHRRK